MPKQNKKKSLLSSPTNSNENSKNNKKLVPINKKELTKKLIPFFLLSLVAIAVFVLSYVLPSFSKMTDRQKLGMYLAAPIILVIFSIFCFYLFDKAYCLYNIKHNDKMRKFLSKFFVKPVSPNGCFRLKEIYINNPLQYAWDLDGEKIIEAYRKWDIEAYENDIKYYMETISPDNKQQ